MLWPELVSAHLSMRRWHLGGAKGSPGELHLQQSVRVRKTNTWVAGYDFYFSVWICVSDSILSYLNFSIVFGASFSCLFVMLTIHVVPKIFDPFFNLNLFFLNVYFPFCFYSFLFLYVYFFLLFSLSFFKIHKWK